MWESTCETQLMWDVLLTLSFRQWKHSVLRWPTRSGTMVDLYQTTAVLKPSQRVSAWCCSFTTSVCSSSVFRCNKSLWTKAAESRRMKRLSASVRAEGWEDIWGWGAASGWRGDYSPPLTFSALPAPLMADRTHKGTCPIPEYPPASPCSPPLTWPAFLAHRGSSPWLPLHPRPPQTTVW